MLYWKIHILQEIRGVVARNKRGQDHRRVGWAGQYEGFGCLWRHYVRGTLQFVQGLTFCKTRFQSIHLSQNCESSSLHNLHAGALMPSPGFWKTVKVIESRVFSGLWGSFPHFLRVTRLLRVILPPFFSLFSSSLSSIFHMPYNIASRKILLRNKSSHIIIQLLNCHFSPVEIKSQDSLSLLPFSPNHRPAIRASVPLHILFPLSRMAVIA